LNSNLDQDSSLKELIIYTIAAVSSLFVLNYTVHMFVGGLVSEQTETAIKIVVGIIGFAVISFMYWDVIKRRR